ncbi:MAG TPA: hypothetical protein DCZ95_14905 [Verrucomicrobia bacterium]|nr:MAG: hypothetical protein A2X46_17990 [Lentisphaerae bacterium GWF2_57_35]HBA85374.1 hypothetical protein [Verrucomicrobiota bacterium]
MMHTNGLVPAFATILCCLAGASFAENFTPIAQLDLHPRVYYMNRHFSTPLTQESLAAGGWLDVRSGSWHGLSLSLSPYTSQRLQGDEDKDGGGLLAPGQKGYTVLGQAYLQADWNRTSLRLYRQILESPFINSFDVRMTPKTVEAYTLDQRFTTNLVLKLSQVEGIKDWNGTTFQSMTDAAGIEEADRPVTLGGLTWSSPALGQLQAWDYVCHDFMNIAYAQWDLSLPLSENMSLLGSLQGLDQRSLGDELGGAFTAAMGGLQGGVKTHGLQVLLAYTLTDNSHDIVNPWGAYQGFTSIAEEDSNLAGEQSWALICAYDFTTIGLDGLVFSFNHSEAWVEDSLLSPEQFESDFTLDYQPQTCLKGFACRLRYANVRNSLSTGNLDYDDYRVVFNYVFPIF